MGVCVCVGKVVLLKELSSVLVQQLKAAIGKGECWYHCHILMDFSSFLFVCLFPGCREAITTSLYRASALLILNKSKCY